MMKNIKRVHDFKALELKFSENMDQSHTIYFKEHSVREHTKNKPPGRTLFVVNIPPYADEYGISNAFSEAGTIQSVKISAKPNSPENNIPHFIPEQNKPCFKIAYVVFKNVSDLHKALTLTKLNCMNSNNYQIKVGLNKWIDEYNKSIIKPKMLKESIEQFMKIHDEHTKQVEKRDKELEQEDDEGWVTVTKRGKVQSFARTEKVENKIMEKEEKNKKRKELKNFYTFQIRESKMKHIVSLRQKFEEDKKKIAQIKQSRRFKPF